MSQILTRLPKILGKLVEGQERDDYCEYALAEQPGIHWQAVNVFHMDEYLGMSDDHPASFPLYIRAKLTDHVGPRAFYAMRGDAPDVEAELARYAGLLARYPPDACVLGIGENGHLAFNDPPADFDTQSAIHVVELDERCRGQQVGEGHFHTIDDVPPRALSLTVPALLDPAHVLAVVPEARKAQVHDNLSNVKAEVLGSGFAPLDSGELRKMEVPALLVTGAKSISLFHRLIDHLEEMLPKVERVEIPGASHMMHEDNATAYNVVVRSFLESQRAVAGNGRADAPSSLG